MTDRFLPDYGLYLLHKGLRRETRLVSFDLPVDHLTRSDLRTVSITVQQGLYECFAPLIVQQVINRP